MLGLHRFMSSRKHVTDAEYVERIRRNMRTMERVRPWFIGFYLVLAIGTICLCAIVTHVIRWLGQPVNNLPVIGFAVGVSLGIMMGLLIWDCIHGLFYYLLLSDFRSERLLIKYHDAIAAALDNISESSEDEGAVRAANMPHADPR